MSQAYSNPKRENDPYALPDLEVWYHTHAKRERCALNAGHKAEMYGECIPDEEGDCGGSGWYYWSCFPGCLPNTDPFGERLHREATATDGRYRRFRSFAAGVAWLDVYGEAQQ